MSSSYIIRKTTIEDYQYIPEIIAEIAISAAERKVAKGQRTKEFIEQKMYQGWAVIAIHPQNNEWMGFSYIEVWQHQKYIATSGLIVSPKYRGLGISKPVKKELFIQSRKQFPEAKLLSLTTHPAVIHINNELGYRRVPYHYIIKDRYFRKGGNSWIDYREILEKNQRVKGYVAMLFEP